MPETISLQEAKTETTISSSKSHNIVQMENNFLKAHVCGKVRQSLEHI